VSGLARGWPEDVPVKLDESSDRIIRELFEKLPEESRGRLVGLAGRWGSRALEAQARAIAASFLAKLEDDGESDRSRIESARRFMDISRLDPEAPGKLLALAGGRAAPELAAALIEAAARSDVSATGAAIIETVPSLTPAARSAAVRVLLGRAEWTRLLLGALDSGSLDAGDLTLDQKQALAAHPDRSLAQEARKVLERRSELPSPDRQAVLDELVPLASKAGDPARGKEVYLKQCARCHMHGTEGQKIGPDLTGIAVHPKAEILSQVIDPNRSVEGTYRVYTAITKEGTVVNGLLLSESRTALELVDTDAKKHAVQREDLAQLVASAKSLMPEGFEKQIPPEDMVNLLEFLAQRGKYLPLPLDKAATVVSTRGMFSSEDSRQERLVFRDWGTKTFEGVPYQLVDPQGGRKANAILLNGPQGNIPPRMPRAVRLPCNAPAKAIHFLGGVSGWGFPGGKKGSVSLIVRLHFEDGGTEDHPLLNGEHMADYIRRVDVPGSKFAFTVGGGRQLRCLAVVPKKNGTVKEIELLKGEDDTAPIVMAVTVETAALP
jgi:putative heme-binding domain-containing protein